LKETFGVEKVDPRSLALFADFIEKCTAIDPSKRLTAEEALIHPFLNILKERHQSQLI